MIEVSKLIRNHKLESNGETSDITPSLSEDKESIDAYAEYMKSTNCSDLMDVYNKIKASKETKEQLNKQLKSQNFVVFTSPKTDIEVLYFIMYFPVLVEANNVKENFA